LKFVAIHKSVTAIIGHTADVVALSLCTEPFQGAKETWLKNRMTFVFMVLSLLVVGTTVGLTASAGPNDVCSGSKVDFENLPATVEGVTITVVDEKTVHFDIPDGSTVEVCVKAGSAKQGNGPQHTLLTADGDVSHSSGKDLSHVSVITVAEPTPTPSPTDPPVPT
jgi:hypothetical protein